MPMHHRIVAIVLVAALALLTGCGANNTEEELAQQRLSVLKSEATSLDALKADLGSSGPLEAPGTVSIFISKNLINSALKGAAGVTLPIPNVEGATITIKQIVTDLKVGYPLVTIDAEATKRDLGATFEVVGTARLDTKIDPASPSQLLINVALEDFVPRAQWGPFDFKIKGFVNDIIKTKLNSELSNLASIKIPISTEIPLSLPAAQIPVNFPGAVAEISTPALNVSGHAAVSRFIVLPDGLHVYGTVSAKAGS
ncbi:hypothetical protein QN397_19680 [Variovorax sp. RTB1]|uniref:hypothetical protein n=1 Tax=Variovorax sp. RTB1 TaxID=3048631 RepID=UPI002B22B866|nr:hypothetical protein [Variovorax sp. RTB1]MEB0113532.1 hypothetical protein [Variovorax sp. RTB1]